MRSEGLYVNENSTDTSWDRTSDLPICSTARFMVGPWFVMFNRMHVHIFVAHSYYNPFTPCEYCTVLLCRSIHNSKEEFGPYLNDYNCCILHVVVLMYCVAAWNWCSACSGVLLNLIATRFNCSEYRGVYFSKKDESLQISY